jgi:hypothetical protein
MEENSVKHKLFWPLFAALTIHAGITPREAQAADNPQRQCYRASLYDRDGDGYANLGALSPDDPRFTMDAPGNRCPDGYVERAGDCNDSVASTRPRSGERSHNSVDDNCNGITDEPEFYYYTAADNVNTTSKIRLTLYLNHPDIRAAARAGGLYVDVDFAALNNSSNEQTAAKLRMGNYMWDYAYGSVDLTGLSAGRVYRARMSLFRREANGSYTRIGPSANYKTGYFYSMTDSEIVKVHARFQIVMKGLKQYSDSRRGYVGYAGTIAADGTRYGADLREAWCSEFYSWVTGEFLRNMNGNDVEDLRSYFSSYDSLYAASEIPTRAGPGDYMPLDTNGDNKRNHSAMFLAYDTSQANPIVWCLEGNAGNEVKIVDRAADFTGGRPVFHNLGYITNSMLR